MSITIGIDDVINHFSSEEVLDNYSTETLFNTLINRRDATQYALSFFAKEFLGIMGISLTDMSKIEAFSGIFSQISVEDMEFFRKFIQEKYKRKKPSQQDCNSHSTEINNTSTENNSQTTTSVEVKFSKVIYLPEKNALEFVI